MHAAPAMRVGTEADFAAATGWMNSPYYCEFAAPVGAPFSTFAKLKSDYDETSVVMVLRSSRQGLAGVEERAMFARILPSIRDAIELQAELDRRSLRIAARSWDSTDTPAYYCNPHMKVLAMSGAGERLASRGELAVLRRGYLHLVDERSHRHLAKAVVAASRNFSVESPFWKFQTMDRDAKRFARVAVSPMSAEKSDALLSAGALVLMFEAPKAAHDAAWRCVRLTAAEQDIARQLLAGIKTARIAEARGVSLLTIQTQIKAMHQKLGVTHRAELLAQLHRILSN